LLKVLSVFGTRPEAIKMAPVVQELSRQAKLVESRVCVTAQHRAMLDQVLEAFQILPDWDLDIMAADQALSEVAARVLSRLDAVLVAFRPDWVVVQGDTTTALAAALAAFHRGVRVAHVEAGLRSGDRRQPFPEEINRRLADILADLHFAPTRTARRHLLAEGLSEATIEVTGNTGIDALLSVARREDRATEASGPRSGAPGQQVVLVTAHRRESFGAPIRAICGAIRQLATARKDLHFVYPVHPNPQVIGPVQELLVGLPNVTLTEPLAYVPFVRLMQRARLILTDSGGLQEEAPSLGKPVLVLREVTERPEAVEAGTVRLVGSDQGRICEWVTRLLDEPELYDQMARAVNPYGDGLARCRVVARLLASAGIEPPAELRVMPFDGEGSER
jgi:UDP-N-acetylglucosamine 2-epimerase (non-hydrolysing)